MKRLKKTRSIKYKEDFNDYDDTDISLDNVKSKSMNIIEAQIQKNDTLQSIAIKFNCQVAELKRLNKIDKDNEIHARTIIKVPMSAHSILLQTLPTVHKSGNNSPNHSINKETLLDKNLDEKLLIASVSSGTSVTDTSVNDIILNTEIKGGKIYSDYSAEEDEDGDEELASPSSKLLSRQVPQPRSLKKKTDLTCSGSDCDISWICLLICILGLCFAIPLIYVVYIAEHLEKYQHKD